MLMDAGKPLTLEEVIRSNLKPKALEASNLEQFYTDISAGRGDNPMKVLHRLFEDATENQQILFSGYTGCGKTTELNKLQKELETDYLVLNYSVQQELNMATLNYIELFITTMEKLFQLAQDSDIPIKEILLKSIISWTDVKDLEKIKAFTTSYEAEAGLETKTGLPYLLQFFGKMRASVKSNYDNKETITQTIKHRLPELVQHCNDMILEIKNHVIEHKNKKGLIIIVEDLDKTPLEFAEKVFFENTPILCSLETHIIYTLPISLVYHPKSNVLRNNFEIFDLPMVKVKTKEGENFEQGRDLLFKLVLKRVPEFLFEQKELIYKFIDLSGGCIRDIFIMLNKAANTALNRGVLKIGEQDFQSARSSLISGYRNTISGSSVYKYYEILENLYSNNEKQIENPPEVLDLRHNLCILGYNGENWVDLHPAVRVIIEERLAARALK